ncbi:juvenile hormone epoxide hydrolase 2-like [Episyrphus balteatus]|uniref:juvenile hormone epoxide hydrolase 2-like n=1 Tax=Episyrphus balteatus TaxID=286459 RepID=UPI002485B552|nr:juvenile hormone epoxide hydrolase 2-like [Episyrphus balteatus]
MGFMARVLFVVLSLGTAVLYQNYRNISKPLPPPALDVNAYWGPGLASSYKEDASIKPFTIKYAEAVNDLKQQLARPLKLHAPLEDVNFEYGFNSKALRNVITYWRDNYLTRWSEREQFLNQFPQFTTQIQGLKIHFLHVKPTKPGTKKVVPLLLLHGWPGSVREFYELIPFLTTPSKDSDYVFEVIAPSLVGYGWSQGASKKNFGAAEMAVVFRNLMLRVGHKKFLIQGGDWGSIIGSNVATLFPENSIGYHSNLCFTNSLVANIKGFITELYPPLFLEKHQEEFHIPGLDKFFNLLEESGYFHIQATKPDTIGTALLNNPVGLAAYILEKFSTWTNLKYRNLPDGGLTQRFTMDALLDNLMIYYLTDSITTSQRLYAEVYAQNQRDMKMDRVPTSTPTGCARFRHDLAHSTDWQLKDKFTNLVHSTYHNDGGHFIALEQPKILYKDFVEFVKKVMT